MRSEMRRVKRPEDGSIAVVVIVVMITSMLAVAMLASLESGLRSSRRSGDSANALQVADAGVNAAAQYVASVPSTQTVVTDQVGTVGDGKYVFNAERLSQLSWAVTALGTDSAGLQRRVSATAYTNALFGYPIFVNQAATMAAGTRLDSYSTGTTPQTQCTKLGKITINDPGQFQFNGNGGGNANCQRVVWDPSWNASIDGCDFPSGPDDINKPLPLKNAFGADLFGPGRCPVSGSARVPLHTPSPVVAPTSADITKASSTGGVDAVTDTFTCDATNKFQAGKVYYFTTINLRDGCTIANAAVGMKPVILYATKFSIGIAGGSGQLVNPPQAPFCPALNGSDLGTGQNPSVGTAFCSKWVGNLRLNLIPGSGAVTFEKGLSKFWGIINAPSGTLDLKPSTFEAFGAAVSNTVSSAAQFTWHFDDDLAKGIGTGKFGVKNWREEPT